MLQSWCYIVFETTGKSKYDPSSSLGFMLVSEQAWGKSEEGEYSTSHVRFSERISETKNVWALPNKWVNHTYKIYYSGIKKVI